VDLILYHVKDCLVDVIWALIMEHDEIEENVHLFTGESGQHVVSVVHGCLVDAVSMAWIGGRVNPSGTVRGLSHAVEEVVQILAVFCLGLVDSTVDLPRIGGSGSGCLAGFLTLGEDLSDVGIGFVHAVSMAPPGAVWGSWWTVPQLAQPRPRQSVSYPLNMPPQTTATTSKS